MRVRRLETAMFTKMMPSLGRTAHVNYKVAMLRAFLDNTKEFDNLRRYATSIERAYHNAIAELTKLQKQREIHEIGSVSQTPEPKPFTRGPLPAQAIRLTNTAAPTSHADTILRSSGT